MGRPDPPGPAAAVFGDRLALAERYAELLATQALVRGLIGPREVSRLWDRHLLNCAVVTDLVPSSVRVVDVGSGAGLPGLVFALRRPDLRVDLVESLQRRADFLTETVAALGLADRVRVIRGRAEDPGVVAVVGGADIVTARAVAPLDRLVRWCLPLVSPGGRLLALKGLTAQGEMDEHAAAIARAGGIDVGLRFCGAGVVEPPTAVVTVTRDPAAPRTSRRTGSRPGGPAGRTTTARAKGRG